MNLYSATMLVKYIKCNHIISNDFNEKKLKLKRNTRTVADKLRLEKVCCMKYGILVN